MLVISFIPNVFRLLLDFTPLAKIFIVMWCCVVWYQYISSMKKEMCFITFGIFFSFRLQVKSIETKINSFMETINTLSEITNGSHVVAKTNR